MTESIRSFDTQALYLALDARRTELGLSWTGVANQLWEMSSDLNDRRQGPPLQPIDADQHGEEAEDELPARPVHGPVARADP